MWGIMPSSRDLRKSKQRGKASSSLHSFRIMAANLSGPTAEYLPTSSIALIISSGQKDMSSRQKGGIWMGSSGRGGNNSLGTMKAFLYCTWRSSLITLGFDWRLPSLSVRGPIPLLVLQKPLE